MMATMTTCTLSLSLLLMFLQTLTTFSQTSAMSLGLVSGSGSLVASGQLPPLFPPPESTTTGTNMTQKCEKAELELFCQVCATHQCSVVDTERCYWKCTDPIDSSGQNLPNLLDSSPVTLV